MTFLTSEEINKQLDEALEEPESPMIFQRFSTLFFFIAGAVLGIIMAGPAKEVLVKKVESGWRYESQPYSLEADGSVVYYHGYTQDVTDNPISDKPYSVSTDGKVIFYHGK